MGRYNIKNMKTDSLGHKDEDTQSMHEGPVVQWTQKIR